jgi:hypothetical protein
VQFNNAGSLDATANLTFNNTTNVLTLAGNIQTNNANLGNSAVANYFTGNFFGRANTANTVLVAAQPNITSLGTLTSLTVAGGVANLGNVSNVKMLGASGYLYNDSSNNLTYQTVVTQSIPGTANTMLYSSGSNNILASGNIKFNDPQLVILGTLSVSGNANVGNIGATNAVVTSVSATTVTGTLTTNAQPNITSVGTLAGLTVSSAGLIVSGAGNVNAGNITATGVFAGNGANLTTLTGSNVTGTVANATYALSAGSATNAAALLTTLTTSGTAFIPFISATANGNYAHLSNANFSANLANGAITATTFVGALSGAATSATTAGTVTTNAQPNITSVGTLTGLGVNGTVTAVAFTANTGVFTGNGNGLSSIVGANVTGTVANATYALSAGTAGSATSATNAAALLTTLTTTGTVFIPFISATANGNYAHLSNANFSANLANGAITATTFVGALSGAATSATNAAALLTTLTTTGTVFIPFISATANGNYAHLSNANFSANLANGAITATTFVGALSGAATSATTAGTVTTNAQPNITSVGTLTSLAVTGNANIGNINSQSTTGASFNINGATQTTANTAGGNINVTSGTGNGTGKGGGLYAYAGNAAPSGNATGGEAQLAAGTGYGQGQGGQVGIYAGASGNAAGAFGGNIILTGGTYTGVGGNLVATAGAAYGTDKAGGVTVIAGGAGTGTGTPGNVAIQVSTALTTGAVAQTLANVLVVTGTGVNVTGTLNTGSGNANIGNLGTAQVLASGLITTPQFVSNIATGTAPIVVTSTTRVNNLNVAYANVADNINVIAGSGNNFLIFANAATGNIAEVTSTGLIANLSNNSITATTFVGALSGAATTAGTVTTNAQPNITSTGTLTSMTSSGNVQGANVIATSYTIRSVNAAVSAAGTTQGTGTALTREFNRVSTVASGAGVVLPTAVAGMAIVITNTSANSLLVYPATGAQINALAANVAYTQTTLATLQYVALTATQWYTVGATYA